MSIPTFSSYQPPGVYVQDVSTPVAVSTGVPQQILAIVGPALGYRTAVESFKIFEATPALLSFNGVYTSAVTGPPAIAAPVVTTATGTLLTIGVDYALTVTQDPSGDPGLAVTSVTRVNTSPTLIDGAQVSITYNYADSTYYQVQTFIDYQSAVNAYGQPFLSSAPTTANASQVANPLSLGALMAFQNGANTIIAVALNPADGSLESQYQAAYAKLANNYSAAIVVPVFTDDLTPPSGTVAAYAQQLAADLNNATTSAANSGYPQIGFFGLPRNYSETDLSITALATSLSSHRIVLVYPEIVNLYNSLTGQTFQASGCYVAVALGALLSSLPVNTGLTQQQVSGFAGLPQNEITAMTPSFMNGLAAEGTTIVFQNWNGALLCRQGLTTDVSGINFSEISMVRQADALKILIQLGVQNLGLIGSPITATTVATVQTAIMGLLEQAVNDAVIVSWTNLTVAEQVYPSGNPTVIAVTFSYAPALPLNYITVTMSIDLTNGTTSTTQSNQNAAVNG